MASEIDIEKNYPGFTLKVSCKISGSSMGILGSSGSGKTMTLRCIAGIEQPDRGRIVVNGRTLFDSEKGINLKPQERRIGYLFQNYALFPTMTVEENIGCGFREKDKAGKDAMVREYIKRYQLEGLERRRPSQLSGGQQQRVALARMMMGKPDMILLDEPFSALDGPTKELLQKDMQDFLKEYTGDMLLVTHNRDEAFKFCQELMLISKGKTLVCGETREVFRSPLYLEAAQITGCKNFSRIRKTGDFCGEAVDWGIFLETEEKIPKDAAYVGIRGHWLVPVDTCGKNSMKIQVVEYIETTFEHQYLVKNVEKEDASSLWWMRPKSGFLEKKEANLPKSLYLPPEHLMFLK